MCEYVRYLYLRPSRGLTLNRDSPERDDARVLDPESPPHQQVGDVQLRVPGGEVVLATGVGVLGHEAGVHGHVGLLVPGALSGIGKIRVMSVTKINYQSWNKRDSSDIVDGMLNSW